MGKKSKTKPAKDSQREAKEQPTQKRTHDAGHKSAEEDAELRSIRSEVQRRRKLSKDVTESKERRNETKSLVEQLMDIPPFPLPTPDQSLMAIALAIQYDEASNDETVLQTPLESGSFYNSNRFAAAWQHLQSCSVSWSKTMPRTELSDLSGRHIESHATPSLTTLSMDPQLDTRQAALTPIIVSGLLSEMTSDSITMTSTEVVQLTQQMRRNALSRVQMRKQQEKIMQIVYPVSFIVLAIFWGHYALQQFQTTLDEYGFGTECDRMLPLEYRQACRAADASTWKTLGLDVESCTVKDCSSISDDNKLVPLYAQHTLFEPTEWSVIPLEQIVGGTGNAKPRKKRRKSVAKQQQRSSNNQDFDDAVESPVRWLGDSVVNSLVRKAIVDAKTKNEYAAPFALLDVGSGLSSLLYSLLTPDFPFRHWTYHGVSISQPEIRHSRQLLHRHHVLQASRAGDLPLKNITLQQSNFDDAFPVKSYDAIVAVESLSFSPNLTRTIVNLAASLKSKGTLVVVDDVPMPWFQSNDCETLANRTTRTSMVTHEAWLEAFAPAGLVMQQAPRDLNLEYDRSIAVESFSRSRKQLQGLWGNIADWYGRNSDGVGTEGTIARGMQLMSDLVQQSEETELRLSAHSKANLTLMMYVCTKK